MKSNDLMKCADDVFIPRRAIKVIYRHETTNVFLAAVEFRPVLPESVHTVEHSATLPEWVKTVDDVYQWWEECS